MITWQKIKWQFHFKIVLAIASTPTVRIKSSQMSELEIKTNTEDKNKSSKPTSVLWKETIKFLIIAIAIVLPIRIFIAQPFIVSGASMEPTFHNGEYLIIDEISYRFKEPVRGEVIVFRYPLDREKFFIKRIIGLPQDTISIKDGKVSILNAEKGTLDLTEDYTSSNIGETLTESLGEGEYFVLGDNRGSSSDSRVWGKLKRKDIIGRPVLRLLPLSRIGVFPGRESLNN
jgi:signal peptidase I